MFRKLKHFVARDARLVESGMKWILLLAETLLQGLTRAVLFEELLAVG
jgi:hypothetical protein